MPFVQDPNQVNVQLQPQQNQPQGPSPYALPGTQGPPQGQRNFQDVYNQGSQGFLPLLPIAAGGLMAGPLLADAFSSKKRARTPMPAIKPPTKRYNPYAKDIDRFRNVGYGRARAIEKQGEERDRAFRQLSDRNFISTGQGSLPGHYMATPPAGPWDSLLGELAALEHARIKNELRRAGSI